MYKFMIMALTISSIILDASNTEILRVEQQKLNVAKICWICGIHYLCVVCVSYMLSAHAVIICLCVLWEAVQQLLAIKTI